MEGINSRAGGFTRRLEHCRDGSTLVWFRVDADRQACLGAGDSSAHVAKKDQEGEGGSCLGWSGLKLTFVMGSPKSWGRLHLAPERLGGRAMHPH